MFNKFEKNIKNYVKLISNFQTLISVKTAIYFGLAAYWGVILLGTIFNI